MRLLMVRHAETGWNLEGRYQGRADIEMCASGLATARRTARTLAETPVALLLASPLKRACSTAAVIGEALGGLPIVTDERLTEIDFGEWQGLTQSQVKERWPRLLRCWKNTPDKFRFPGGESLQEARARVVDFMHHPPWADRCDEGCILTVSHAGPIRLAELIAEARPLAHFRRIPAGTGEVHAFEWRASGRLSRVRRW